MQCKFFVISICSDSTFSLFTSRTDPRISGKIYIATLVCKIIRKNSDNFFANSKRIHQLLTRITIVYFQQKLLSPPWNPFTNNRFQYSPYNSYSNNNSVQDSVADISEQLADLSILDRRPLKRPPPSYLCHLCFQKGHYIKDCPKVS